MPFTCAFVRPEWGGLGGSSILVVSPSRALEGIDRHLTLRSRGLEQQHLFTLCPERQIHYITALADRTAACLGLVEDVCHWALPAEISGSITARCGL